MIFSPISYPPLRFRTLVSPLPQPRSEAMRTPTRSTTLTLPFFLPHGNRVLHTLSSQHFFVFTFYACCTRHYFFSPSTSIPRIRSLSFHPLQTSYAAPRHEPSKISRFPFPTSYTPRPPLPPDFSTYWLRVDQQALTLSLPLPFACEILFPSFVFASSFFSALAKRRLDPFSFFHGSSLDPPFTIVQHLSPMPHFPDAFPLFALVAFPPETRYVEYFFSLLFRLALWDCWSPRRLLFRAVFSWKF